MTWLCFAVPTVGSGKFATAHPITGSLNRSSAMLLQQSGRLKKTYLVAQGTSIGRSGGVLWNRLITVMHGLVVTLTSSSRGIFWSDIFDWPGLANNALRLSNYEYQSGIFNQLQYDHLASQVSKPLQITICTTAKVIKIKKLVSKIIKINIKGCWYNEQKEKKLWEIKRKHRIFYCIRRLAISKKKHIE